MRAPILHQLDVPSPPRGPLGPDARQKVLGGLLLALLAACQGPQHAQASMSTDASGVAGASQRATARDAVTAVLEDWHAAASEADAERYLGHLTPGAVFLGTDAVERWDVEAFTAYVNQNFTGPSAGWNYLPTNRSIEFAPGGEVAWFDELLTRGVYREVRGTGVMLWQDGRWRIAQYNMSYTVPNGVAVDVLKRILDFRRGRS